MPGIQCRCGHAISYGEIPCPDEWLFISDTDFDKVSGLVDAEDVYMSMQHFLKCPVCGRLWVFWRGFGEVPQEFVPVAPEAPAD